MAFAEMNQIKFSSVSFTSTYIRYLGNMYLLGTSGHMQMTECYSLMIQERSCKVRIAFENKILLYVYDVARETSLRCQSIFISSDLSIAKTIVISLLALRIHTATSSHSRRFAHLCTLHCATYGFWFNNCLSRSLGPLESLLQLNSGALHMVCFKSSSSSLSKYT